MSEQRDTWAGAVAARARGDKLDDAQREEIERYEKEHPEVLLERPMWEAFGALGSGADRHGVELDDVELAARVLARAQMQESSGVDDQDAEPVPVGSTRRPRRRIALSLLGLAGAAAAAVLLLGPWPMLLGLDGAARRGADSDALTTTPMVSERRHAGGEGEWMEPAPTRRRTAVAPGDCAEGEDCGQPAVEGETSGELVAVEPVEEVVPVPEAAEPTARERGAASRDSHANVEDRLAQAQRLFASGDRGKAMKAYKRLIREHPDAPESHAARVTLGRLALSSGRPRAALQQFDRYLAKGGALSEEARHGRVRALAQLGEEAQELAAIESFLRAHPESVHARALRERAQRLR